MAPAIPIALAASAAVAAFTYASVAPACTFWGPVISKGNSALPRYALTFDDGPTENSTERILDILNYHNVKATFFVIGVNAEKNPKLLERIHAEGHIIGNHSYN